MVQQLAAKLDVRWVSELEQKWVLMLEAESVGMLEGALVLLLALLLVLDWVKSMEHGLAEKLVVGLEQG